MRIARTLTSQIFFFPRLWNISTRTDRAIEWIRNYSLPAGGIQVTSRIRKPYPEVSGYLIPTLINWGERNLAYEYATFLAKNQNSDGGFPTPQSSVSGFFDTGQVLRGLFAINEIFPEFEEQIIRGLNYMESCISETGEVILTEAADWGGEVPRTISLYAIAPCINWLRENSIESKLLNKFELATKKLVSDPKILELTSVNHFHAYVMDALVDLGYSSLALEGLKGLRKNSGSMAFFGNATENWICTTGQFQYAIVYCKLNQYENALASFLTGARLQNRSGGWYGSRGKANAVTHAIYPILPRKKMYFPSEEIPWANKYFLDALTCLMQSNFQRIAPTFQESIEIIDNRYRAVSNFISKLPSGSKVLDAGCGKGRFLISLAAEFPEISFVALDISSTVMANIPNKFHKIKSPITNIDTKNSSFDAVFTVEALEHAGYTEGALKEIHRVLKRGGSLLIIDKKVRFTRTVREPWEKWFSENELRRICNRLDFDFVNFSALGSVQQTKNLFFTCEVKKW